MHLSEEVKMVFFLLILVSNLCFFIHWAMKFYHEMKLIVLLKMGKIYLLFCLCNDQQKLEREKELILRQKEKRNEER